MTMEVNIMSGKNTSPAFQGRHDRLIQERIHDPYKSQQKLSGPTLCPDCKAIFSGGRWQWLGGLSRPMQLCRCPACSRVHDKVPAGMLSISGEFFDQHRDQILNLLHNKVDAEKNQHPLKRVMDIKELTDGSVMVTFTDTHLPRDVGKALVHAYKGKLDIHYAEDEDLTRVKWVR